MSLNEVSIKIPGEYIPNVFGQFDAFAKKIERTLHVTLVLRDDSLKIIGAQGNIDGAKEVFEQLIALAERGNVITEQNVNYALALLEEHRGSEIVEIDKDIICHTINGKPVKPKTIGQKEYVDAIRKKMIVFGMGPAGTGKTYLAMAMAISSIFLSTLSATSSPDFAPGARSFCVASPVTTTFEPKPIRVRNIFICAGVVFCASSSMINAYAI